MLVLQDQADEIKAPWAAVARRKIKKGQENALITSAEPPSSS